MINSTDRDLVLKTAFGSLTSLEVATDDIFAVWWDPQFDHHSDAQIIFTQLKRIRQDCLHNLGMADPPNPSAGYYYNVYIHHGQKDCFPNQWGNGQGTDKYGMPFLTLPIGVHTSESNLYHEGFHIFQYCANSPGFAYQGDSQWYIEASAQWYQCQKLPDDINAFVEAGTMGANPHLALWHSFSNHAAGDPTDWLYQVRQYGMHTYLFYLTNVADVAAELITNGFYLGIDLSPQEYHYRQIGADRLRGHFSDWAARNTAGLDYLTPEQIERATQEVINVGDPNNLHPDALTYTDQGTHGNWIRPPEALKPRGWAYNVIRIKNNHATTYKFILKGDKTGSEGAASHFEGRIVVVGESGPSYSEMEMSNPLTGEGRVMAKGSDRQICLVVTSVPEHFSGTQTYGYKVQIQAGPNSGD